MCRETALYNAYTFCEAVVQPFPARCKLVMYAGRADSDPGNILEQGNWATESQVTVPPMQIPVSGQMTDVQVHLQVLLENLVRVLQLSLCFLRLLQSLSQ